MMHASEQSSEDQGNSAPAGGVSAVMALSLQERRSTASGVTRTLKRPHLLSEVHTVPSGWVFSGLPVVCMCADTYLRQGQSKSNAGHVLTPAALCCTIEPS